MKRDLEDIDRAWPGPALPGSPSPVHAQQVLIDLMARIADGEREAFRELYLSTSSRLLATARRLVADAGAAEDVVQETYLRVWRYSRSYRPECSAPMTWITQILRNRAIDLRSRHRVQEVTLHEETDVDADADHEAGPEWAAAQATTDPRVAAALARLDGVHRQVLSLAYHRGLSHAEIAEHLGVPLGTAKTWVRRALLALRAALAGGMPAASITSTHSDAEGS